MKIKQYKKTTHFEFDRSKKDQKQAWELLDSFDPFYDAGSRCVCFDDEWDPVPEHNICIACGKPRK